MYCKIDYLRKDLTTTNSHAWNLKHGLNKLMAPLLSKVEGSEGQQMMFKDDDVKLP